ncbi:transposase [Shewanella sp. ULN5]|uniref:transposase n=1 Tax=Shewanella sp. ULN5 TaxID=2994678 RepID=UPI00273F6404|nr:transposase [Shewanella sp. ULN5]MDP5146948.1 transposase [Shewanella sp. ULN5]
MVNDPAEYIWSSYQINALGETSELCTPHQIFLSKSQNPQARQASYRALFQHQLDAKMISDIRQATNKGMVIGSDTFQDQIEKLTGKVSIQRKWDALLR